MPTLDPSRATFVQEEFRYSTTENLTLKTTYPNAQEIVLNTQLSSASAAALASTMFTECSKVAQVYEVEVDGAGNLETILSTTPYRYTLTSSTYGTDSRTFRMVACEVDWMANKTKAVIRG